MSHVDNIRNSSERITSCWVAWWFFRGFFDLMFFPILGFRDCEEGRPDSRGTLSACFRGFPSRESSPASSTASHDLKNLLTYWNWVVFNDSCPFYSQFTILTHTENLKKRAVLVNVSGIFRSHVATGPRSELYQASQSSHGQLKIAEKSKAGRGWGEEALFGLSNLPWRKWLGTR